MVADQGNTTNGTAPTPGWPPATGHQPPYGYPGPGGPYGSGPVGPLPSRTKTVLITIFFGLLGLIPAYLDGKKAEQQGVSPGRYYTAFGIALAVSSVVWTAIVLILAFSVFAATVRTSSASGSTDSGVFAEEPEAAQGPVEQDWVADWGGSIAGSGDRWGGLSLQMGDDGGELYAGVSYDDLGCSGMWHETSRDASTVTVREVIDHDPDQMCLSEVTRVLQLDASGQMLVDGGGWTAILTAYPD